MKSQITLRRLACIFMGFASGCVIYTYPALSQMVQPATSAPHEEKSFLIPGSVSADFPAEGFLGKSITLNVHTLKTVKTLSFIEDESQNVPGDKQDNDSYEDMVDPEEPMEATGKSGSFSVPFTPHAFGGITASLQVLFTDGTYGQATRKMTISIDPASNVRLRINQGLFEKLKLHMWPGESLGLYPEIIVDDTLPPVSVHRFTKFKVISTEADPAVSVTGDDLVLTAKHFGSAIIEASFAGRTNQVIVEVSDKKEIPERLSNEVRDYHARHTQPQAVPDP